MVVADVEPGTRDRETRLKERGATRRCGVCKTTGAIEAGEIAPEEALAQWETARPADRAVLREIFGLEPAGGAQPGPGPEITPAPSPDLGPEITPEIDALVDSLCEGWLSQVAEAQATAEAEVGAEAAPERARELLRSELFGEVPAPGPAQAEITRRLTWSRRSRRPKPKQNRN